MGRQPERGAPHGARLRREGGGLPERRHIDAGDGPALYLEVQSGAVRERGRRVELVPPAEQAALIEPPAEVSP